VKILKFIYISQQAAYAALSALYVSDRAGIQQLLKSALTDFGLHIYSRT